MIKFIKPFFKTPLAQIKLTNSAGNRQFFRSRCCEACVIVLLLSACNCVLTVSIEAAFFFFLQNNLLYISFFFLLASLLGHLQSTVCCSAMKEYL